MQVNKVDAKCHDLALTQERQKEELLYRLVRLREAQVQKHLFPEVGGEAAHTQTNKQTNSESQRHSFHQEATLDLVLEAEA